MIIIYLYVKIVVVAPHIRLMISFFTFVQHGSAAATYVFNLYAKPSSIYYHSHQRSLLIHSASVRCILKIRIIFWVSNECSVPLCRWNMQSVISGSCPSLMIYDALIENNRTYSHIHAPKYLSIENRLAYYNMSYFPAIRNQRKTQYTSW